MVFSKEDFEQQYQDGKRRLKSMPKDKLKEYIKGCREKGIKDAVAGYIIGWTENEIKEFMEEVEK